VSNAWHLGDRCAERFALHIAKNHLQLRFRVILSANRIRHGSTSPDRLSRAAVSKRGYDDMAKSAAKSVTRSEATGSKVSAAASKVLRSKTASKAEKSVAASALTQTKSVTETTSKKVSAAASKILRSKSASKEAKSVAASALTQKVKKK
jgi:hypothetical protein